MCYSNLTFIPFQSNQPKLGPNVKPVSGQNFQGRLAAVAHKEFTQTGGP